MPIIVDRNMDYRILQNIKNRFPQKNIIKSYRLSTVSGSLATHPDIQIHYLNWDTAVCAPECYEYYKSELSAHGVSVIRGATDPGNTYPDDIAYNVARAGNYVIANLRYTDPEIIKYYKGCGYEFLNTRQGYAKCNTCIADDRTVITEDMNIFRLISGLEGFRAMKLECGSVRLDGFPYGFIGGASGLVDGVLVFCGKPRGTKITDFLIKNRIEYFFGSENELIDYGSIICRR